MEFENKSSGVGENNAVEKKNPSDFLKQAIG